MADTADVVVVGGGVNGASMAWALASRGVKRVVLCEKGALASGASGRSSALVRMHYTNETDARLAVASFPIFRDWTEIMGGGPPVFTPTGFVNVVAAPYTDNLRKNVEMLRQIGINTIALSPAELRDLQPHPNVDDVGAAALPRDRARASRAGEGDRHRGGDAPGGADEAARDLHRQRPGELLQAGKRDPHDRRRALPGLGPRPRRAAVIAARGAVGRRPDPDPPDSDDGAGDPRARLPRLRLLQPGPPRDPRSRGRGGRALPRDSLQRLWVQDRSCGGNVHGRADPGRARQDRGHRALQPRTICGREVAGGVVPVRPPQGSRRACALTSAGVATRQARVYCRTSRDGSRRGGLLVDVAEDGYLLETRGLTKRFGGLVAVDGLALSLRRGEIRGVIGPNGSGKTTTVNLLSGLYRADTGEIWLQGERVDRLRPHEITARGVARTFQVPKLFGNM